MRFISSEEARKWAVRFARPDDKAGHPDCRPVGWSAAQIAYENAPGHQHFVIAQHLVRTVRDVWGSDECLFWITLDGIWSSSENLHLYYRLRLSYGDTTTLAERPALLAMKHEGPDLESFVHLAVLYGWDAYLISAHDYARVAINHDGFATVASRDAATIGDFVKRFTDSDLDVREL